MQNTQHRIREHTHDVGDQVDVAVHARFETRDIALELAPRVVQTNGGETFLSEREGAPPVGDIRGGCWVVHDDAPSLR